MFRIVREVFLAEIQNYILWLIVFFAAGIIFYFSLNYEPDLILVSITYAVIFIIILLLKNYKAVILILLPILFFSCGITTATWRSHNIKFAKITEKIDHAKIYAVVEKIFHSDKKPVRLILNVKKIYTDRKDRKIALKKLQVTTMNFNHDVKVGDFISLYASLYPSSHRLFPGGYDFARHAYFQKIGATAFSVSKIRIIEAARDDSIVTKIENLRFQEVNLQFLMLNRIIRHEIIRTLALSAG